MRQKIHEKPDGAADLKGANVCLYNRADPGGNVHLEHGKTDSVRMARDIWHFGYPTVKARLSVNTPIGGAVPQSDWIDCALFPNLPFSAISLDIAKSLPFPFPTSPLGNIVYDSLTKLYDSSPRSFTVCGSIECKIEMRHYATVEPKPIRENRTFIILVFGHVNSNFAVFGRNVFNGSLVLYRGIASRGLTNPDGSKTMNPRGHVYFGQDCPELD